MMGFLAPKFFLLGTHKSGTMFFPVDLVRCKQVVTPVLAFPKTFKQAVEIIF